MRRGIGLGLALVLISLAVVIYWDNERVVVRDVTISHPDLPPAFDGFRILHITDLESRSFGKNQSRLIETLSSLDYDVVVLTGDYVWPHLDFSAAALRPLVELVRQLPPDTPKFYVLGDNEILHGQAGTYSIVPVRPLEIMHVLDELGARQIYPAAELRRGADSIWLTDWQYFVVPEGSEVSPHDEYAYFPVRTSLSAIDQAWERALREGIDEREVAYRHDFERRALEFLQRDGSDQFNILVSHRAIDFSFDEQLTLSETDGLRVLVDWQLNIAGHTHGGLWRLPLVGPVAHPNLGFFPPDELTYGLHRDMDRSRWVWISSGLAATGPSLVRFRVGNPPEVALLTLRRAGR